MMSAAASTVGMKRPHDLLAGAAPGHAVRGGAVSMHASASDSAAHAAKRARTDAHHSSNQSTFSSKNCPRCRCALVASLLNTREMIFLCPGKQCIFPLDAIDVDLDSYLAPVDLKQLPQAHAHAQSRSAHAPAQELKVISAAAPAPSNPMIAQPAFSFAPLTGLGLLQSLASAPAASSSSSAAGAASSRAADFALDGSAGLQLGLGLGFAAASDMDLSGLDDIDL